MIDSAVQEQLRGLPAVDRLAAQLTESDPTITLTEAIVAARAILDARRAELLTNVGAEPPGDGNLLARAHAYLRSGPQRVLNGTGVIIHTNLGRSPLAEAAAKAVAAAAGGYLDLEYDLTSGARGQRDAHVKELLTELTGAEDAMVVNNGAAATLLAAAAIAGPGKAIVVSRGQLVEIGGGFRIPDVIAQSGAEMIEVGTTNKTRLSDYAQAMHEGEFVILRVHQSNFRTVGFVEEVAIEELCNYSHKFPVIDDLGSGVLAGGLDELLADEPPVTRSVKAGAAVVCFSGDKLLGGPQAGILVGKAEAIAKCRRHPLARALRLGRLPLAALSATLALYRDPERARREIPVLAMLSADPDELVRRATKLAAITGGEIVESIARVGGGALPLTELHGPAVAFDSPDGPDALAARLRQNDPPLIGRIEDGRLLVDPRTLQGEHELEQAISAVLAAR